MRSRIARFAADSRRFASSSPRGGFWLAVLLLPGGSLDLRAQQESASEESLPLGAATPPASVEREELLRGEERRPYNLYVGADVVSQYIARGLVYLDEPSFQPWFELDVPLRRKGEGDEAISTLTAFAGSWNNISLVGSEPGLARTGRRVKLEDWYESDIYGGLRVRLGDHVSSSLRYNFYTSPSDSFRDIHEIDWRVSLDDSSLWPGENFGVYPSLRVTSEFRDEGGPENEYFQPTLTPSWRVPGWSMTLQLPVILGFGADGQYVGADGEERHFGFVQVGARANFDLDLLPLREGSTTVSLGVDHVMLTDPSLGRNGEQHQTVGRIGVSYDF